MKKTIIVSVVTTIATMLLIFLIGAALKCGSCGGQSKCSKNSTQCSASYGHGGGGGYHGKCASYSSSCHGNKSCSASNSCSSNSKCSKGSSCKKGSAKCSKGKSCSKSSCKKGDKKKYHYKSKDGDKTVNVEVIEEK